MKQSKWLIGCMLIVSTIYGMHGPRVSVPRRTSKVRSYATVVSRIRTKEAVSRDNATSLIAMANPYFEGVPGYDCLKKKLSKSFENPNRFAKGYLYELEVALHLMHTRRETICAFEKKFSHPWCFHTREIDIITDRCAYECKNINWESVQCSDYITQLLVAQFAEQAMLVASGVVGVPYFMVCSKNEIPVEWKWWFAQHAILYMEGPH
jgi:hypothetical protein